MAHEVLSKVSLPGSDHLELLRSSDGELTIHFVASLAVTQRLQQYQSTHGNDARTWPLPEGKDREDIILREFILRAKGEWHHPYPHDEICHCRAISLREMEEAIFAGVTDLGALKSSTTVASSCGTCQTDVENVLSFRLFNQVPNR